MAIKNKKSYKLSPEEIEDRLIIESTYVEPVAKKESVKKVKISEKIIEKKPNVFYHRFIVFLRKLLRVEEITLDQRSKI